MTGNGGTPFMKLYGSNGKAFQILLAQTISCPRMLTATQGLLYFFLSNVSSSRFRTQSTSCFIWMKLLWPVYVQECTSFLGFSFYVALTFWHHEHIVSWTSFTRRIKCQQTAKSATGDNSGVTQTLPVRQMQQLVCIISGASDLAQGSQRMSATANNS